VTVASFGEKFDRRSQSAATTIAVDVRSNGYGRGIGLISSGSLGPVPICVVVVVVILVTGGIASGAGSGLPDYKSESIHDFTRAMQPEARAC
jgi:hypothetical protein